MQPRWNLVSSGYGRDTGRGVFPSDSFSHMIRYLLIVDFVLTTAVLVTGIAKFSTAIVLEVHVVEHE